MMANTEHQNNKREETPIYLTTDSTIQSQEEHQHDESVDPGKDNTIDVSDTDLKETDADRYGGPNKTAPIEHQP